MFLVFLSETIWQTELDFMSVNRRHLVVMSVMASPYQNDTRTYESQEDDEYLNDTIFSDEGGGGGGGGGATITGGNANSLWSTDLRHQYGSNKRKNVILPAVGKSRFLELPDLIEAVENQSTKYDKFQGKAGEDAKIPMKAKGTGTAKSSEKQTTENGIRQNGDNRQAKGNDWITIEDDIRKARTTTTSTTMATTTTSTTTATAAAAETTTSPISSTTTLIRTTSSAGTTKLPTSTKPTPSIKTTTTRTITNKLTTQNSNNNNIAIDATTSALPIWSEETSSFGSGDPFFPAITQPSAATSTEIQRIALAPTKHHQHHHSSHSGKSSRRHNGHHRQRKISNSSASQRRTHHHGGRRSGEINSANMPEGLEDFPPKVNRFDEFEYPSTGRIYEHRPSSFEELDIGRARAAIYPKSSTTISTTTRDSNIHIVKPEKLPEIVPSTPVSSNSKIIEIKSKSVKRLKRQLSLPEESQVEIEPEYLVGDLNLNDSSEYLVEMTTIDTSTPSTDVDLQPNNGNVRLDGFAGMLQLFFGIEKPIDVNIFTQPPSAEFVNLVFALLVWCVRYPAVFWNTAKSFATVFSVQMIATACDIIFSFVGISNLFKLQIYSEAQPIQNPGLILNATVTLALFLLSAILMLSSSMIMYLYGHGRLAAKMRDRSIITLKSSQSWIYFAHCASLCYVLALSVVKAPLLNDLSATYRHNLHCPTFMAGKSKYGQLSFEIGGLKER